MTIDLSEWTEYSLLSSPPTNPPPVGATIDFMQIYEEFSVKIEEKDGEIKRGFIPEKTTVRARDFWRLKK